MGGRRVTAREYLKVSGWKVNLCGCVCAFSRSWESELCSHYGQVWM